MNKLKALLGFDPKTTTVKTELIAGMTTFLTMCYILAVNPTILATTGMDKGALFTATAIASAIATFLLAFMAKLPFAQAPSMGLNAFFAFTLCQAMGLTWQQALAVMMPAFFKPIKAINIPIPAEMANRRFFGIHSNILSRILRKVMARKMIPSTSNTANACCQVKPIA